MTIPATASEISYAGDGTSVDFPIPFVFDTSSDLKITSTIAGATAEITTGFSVAGGGGSTGTLTFLTAPAIGTTIGIFDDPDITQPTDYVNNDAFPAESHERALDRVTRIAKRSAQLIRRAFRYPDGDLFTDGSLPDAATRKGKYLFFDALTGELALAANLALTTLTRGAIGDLLYPRTAAEVAAGVTPLDYGYPPLAVERYGADPTGTDASTIAFNAAFDVCALQAGGGIVFSATPGGTYKITGTLTPDTNTTGFDGRGCTLDCSTVSSGAIWAPTQSVSDVNRRPHYNNAHPIKHFVMIGPGGGNTATIAVSLEESVSLLIPGLVFENIGFLGFGTDVYLGDGSFFTSFISCTFAPGSGLGGGAVYSIIQDGTASNTGERQTFINCNWFNKDLCISQGGNSDFHLYGCSLDVNTTGTTDPMVTVSGGRFCMHGGHIEVVGGDTAPVMSVTGTNTALLLIGVEVIVQPARTNTSLFVSDSSCQNGGVVLVGCSVQTASSFGARLISGTGAASITALRVQGNLPRGALAAALNLLAYGDFESASYTGEWTLVGGAVRSNAQAHAGTYSLSFPAVSGTDSNGSALQRCSPGQMLQVELWYRADNITTTGGTFFGQLLFADKNGVTLFGSTIFSITANTAGWVKLTTSVLIPAPPGTVSCALVAGVFGVASGTAQCYIDDVLLNVG